MPDFTKFQPPGVYVEEENTPLVSVTGAQPTVAALVGPARGYRPNTEAKVLTGTTPVVLSKLGIDQASVRVAAADGTVFPSSAYSLTVGAGADSQAGTTQDNTLSIARNGTAIPDGSTVYVTYNYTDANYYGPQRFNDFDDVKDVYGEPFDITTGAILSPLSFAAKIAFENGAANLVLVATAGSATAVTRAQLSTALASLSALSDVEVVVPLPVGLTGTPALPGDTINVANDLKSHVETAALNGLRRVGIIGYETTSTQDPSVVVASFRSPRVVMAWPNRLNYFNGYANADVEVAGYYLAAAYAGMLSNLPVQMSLTKKQVRSFSGIPAPVLQTMTMATKNGWSDAGVAVTELAKDGRLLVRFGTTTQRDTTLTRELSIVRAKDSLVNLIDDTMERANLIGTPIDIDTPLRIKGVIQGCLETAKNTGLIQDYKSLKVRPSPSGDPSVIEVKFQYKPSYALNYVVITFSVDTSTGQTDLQAA